MKLQTRQMARVLLWVVSVPAALILLLYLVLLITPIPLAFLREPVLQAIDSALPDSAKLELGDMALALEGGIYPVLQFSPVLYTDDKSGARVQMEALEVGFSPFRALIGQPGAFVTVVGPHIQMMQDLLGPRLSNFDIVTDPATGQATVRVLEGEDAFPPVSISADGLDVRGSLPAGLDGGLRSDNDWLIYNLEAAEVSLKDIVQQSQNGLFSRLVVRDGVMDMNDSVYGFLRHFTDVSLDISPGLGGKPTVGLFSAALGGRVMNGRLERTLEEDGSTTLTAAVTNIDFASVIPFIDDPESPVAMKGAGALTAAMNFQGGSGRILEGKFHVDMTGVDLKIEDRLYPVVTSIMEIAWEPHSGTFTMAPAEIHIGQSSGKASGIFVLGMDEKYGPIISMSMTGTDVLVHPNDMAAPDRAFEKMQFTGWSAPLYGALGIDQMIATKGDARVETKGRIDMLQDGLGMQMQVAGTGVTADDLKRLWPYLMSPDSRDWFVKNITDGVVKSANMNFNFPIGSVAKPGQPEKPLPPGSLDIEMVGTGVVVKATDTMDPIAIQGDMRLSLKDTRFTVSAEGGEVPTGGGGINVSNAAFVIDSGTPGQRIMEISGDIGGGVQSLIALVKEQQPAALENVELPIDLATLSGDLDLGLVATFVLGENDALQQMDYVINGTLAGFGSTAPIQGRKIGNGQLAFSASQDGYTLAGTADIDGMTANIEVSGTPETTPELLLSAEVGADELAKMGFDVSPFLSGSLKFVGKPLADGAIQVAIDLKQAALTVKEAGISKAKGVDGVLEAVIRQDKGKTSVSGINLAFGDVRLQGDLSLDDKGGLVKAEFSHFGLSPGDQAQLTVLPIEGGFDVAIRGAQLDLKPILQKSFGLGEGAGGVQAGSFDQTIKLDVQLDRALGFYKTTAFNVGLNLSLRGSDLRDVKMTAQLGGGKSVSIASNPAPDGRTLSVAFNDFGAILRLLGVYPRVEGGEGSLVLTTYQSQKIDVGEFQLNNFALIDEDMVAQILGNHQESRALISARNKLEFQSGKASFVRSADRIELTDGVLSGNSVGGTARGFINTKSREYDLVGTYVPLFGLNSVFQKLPLFGPLLGGREGEGLLGVTFAVTGPLDNPQFKINPASMLAVGAFRSLFEFRTKSEQAGQ